MGKHLLILAFSALMTSQIQAQCDGVAERCEQHMAQEFVSDGQSYRALIYDDQVAEYQVTLFANTTYRFAACSGDSDGNLVFDLYDQERNRLFSNAEYANAPYWDFSVEQSMDVTIEARLELKNLESGCAVLLIGFKQ